MRVRLVRFCGDRALRLVDGETAYTFAVGRIVTVPIALGRYLTAPVRPCGFGIFEEVS